MKKNKLDKIAIEKANPDCKFCQGTGIAEYFDMSRMPEVGAGEYELGWLCEHYGGKDACPECFPNGFDLN